MNISLTPKLEEFVKTKVKSGLYHDESEVVRDALRLLGRQEDVHRLKLKRLREAISIADRQVRKGEFATRSIEQVISDNELSAKRQGRRK
jgi:antitoxin ParD1/3/4